MANYFDVIKHFKPKFSIGDRVKIVKNKKILRGCIVCILPWYAFDYSHQSDSGHGDFYYILLDNDSSPMWYIYSKCFIKRIKANAFFSITHGQKNNITNYIKETERNIDNNYTNLLSKKEFLSCYFPKLLIKNGGEASLL